MLIRPIQKRDNQEIAAIIRTSLEEVALDLPGTAYTDPQLDHLSDYYQEIPASAYFVVEEQGQIIAGAGFAPLSQGICELQKCYVASHYRGKGLGTTLLTKVEEVARQMNFSHMYLESSSQLERAIPFYHKMGYESLERPLPNQENHFLMDIWMLKNLT